MSLHNGKQIIRLEHGRMINLTAADGNPIQAMDLGLTLQARSLAAVVTAQPARGGTAGSCRRRAAHRDGSRCGPQRKVTTPSSSP